MTDPGQRLLQAIEIAGYEHVSDFAEVAGVKGVTLRQQIARGSIPTEAAELYARKLKGVGLTTDWLLFKKGEAPSKAKRAAQPAAPTEQPPAKIRRHGAEKLLPVSTIVGAGDEIVEYVGEDPIDEEPAPPGLEDGEVTEVRGRSMLPLFRDGDRLFHHFLSQGDHAHLIGEAVVARLRDGRRFVKILRLGSRRGRYDLHSINPQFAPLEDQQLEAVAEIVWVKKRQRPKNNRAG